MDYSGETVVRPNDQCRSSLRTGLCHKVTPLSAQDYQQLFSAYGIADLSVLETARSIVSRNGRLLHAVMDCLAAQSNDAESAGSLTARELYFIIKAQDENLSPSVEEIESMLAVLSSPMINCVGKAKDEYYAIGSLSEASNKFSFYSRACLSMDDD